MGERGGEGGERSLFSDGKNTKPGNELGTTLMLQKNNEYAQPHPAPYM